MNINKILIDLEQKTKIKFSIRTLVVVSLFGFSYIVFKLSKDLFTESTTALKVISVLLFVGILVSICFDIIQSFIYRRNNKWVRAFNGYTCPNGCDVLSDKSTTICQNCNIELTCKQFSPMPRWQAKNENKKISKLRKEDRESWGFLIDP